MTEDMGFDIVKDLRESAKDTFYDPLKSELNAAADRIELLQEANLKQSLVMVGHLVRIEQLEAALNNCVNVLACFERPDFYQIERTSPIKPYALGALDVARAALEEKKDD